MLARRFMLTLVTLSIIFLIYHLIALALHRKSIELRRWQQYEELSYVEMNESVEVIIGKQRQRIREQGFDFDEIPESHGSANKLLLMTPWHTGSGFLTDLFDSMIGNFHHADPFYGLKEADYVTPQTAYDRISHLFNCDYSRALDSSVQIMPGTQFGRHCAKFPCDRADVQKFCRLFPMQTMKVERLRLDVVADDLLTDVNLRIVYLVRDPRALYMSRKHSSDCRNNPNCYDPNIFCTDLLADYYEADNLQQKYPDRFRIIKYEQLALRPLKSAYELFSFSDRRLSDAVDGYLQQLILEKQTESTPPLFKWMTKLSFEEVRKIQTVCDEAMQLWQYKTISYDSPVYSDEFKNEFYLS